jgi:histidinol-phosphate/aromatic aminotransferase/cobyric acid decarboxylase-like protein
MDWQSLLNQIKLRYEALVAVEDEIGSSYADRAVRNEALFNTVTDAIDGQVKQILVEKENLVQTCRDFISRTISMRKAMGERLSIDASSAERVDIQKVCQSLSPVTNHLVIAISPNSPTTQARTSRRRVQLQ